MDTARLERLTKFRTDYFNTPPPDISQLAADAMIVVIDLETGWAEAEARIATLEGEKAELQRQIDGPEAEDFVSLTQQLKEMTDIWRLVEGKLDAAKVEIAQLRATRERGA